MDWNTNAFGGIDFFRLLFHEGIFGEMAWKFKTQRFIVTFLFFFFGIQFLIDKTQGLFWYNGACHYIFPWSALLALAGIVVSMTVDSRHGKRKSIIGILLAIYIGGGNLVTGLNANMACSGNFIDCIMP